MPHTGNRAYRGTGGPAPGRRMEQRRAGQPLQNRMADRAGQRIYLFQFCVRGAGRLPVRCWRIPRHDVFGHCGRQCVHRHCAGAARQTHAGQGDTALGQHGLCGPRRPNAHRPHRRAGTGRHCAAAPGQPGVRGRRCCGRDAGGKRSAADRRGRACAKTPRGHAALGQVCGDRRVRGTAG